MHVRAHGHVRGLFLVNAGFVTKKWLSARCVVTCIVQNKKKKKKDSITLNKVINKPHVIFKSIWSLSSIEAAALYRAMSWDLSRSQQYGA